MNILTPNESLFQTCGPASWNHVPTKPASEIIRAEQMTQYVHGLAPWTVFAHHTFSWEASVWSAQKSYERFMAKACPEVSYFYALEQNPGRSGFHAHALWADCEAVQRTKVWERWFATYGRNRIEPVASPVEGRLGVARYCAKYVSKEGAWWNVKLVDPDLWHAAQSIPSSVRRVSV